MNGKNDKLLRLARGITLALPVAAAFFAASCTSTSTSLEVAGSSLQPSLNAPSLAQPVAAAQENSNTPAPSGPVQAGQVQIAGTSIAPTKAQTVGLASSAANPAETLQLASNAPGALPVPPIPESIQFPEPVVMTTAGETIPVPGSNEALIASAAKAAAAQPPAQAANGVAANVDPARFGTEVGTGEPAKKAQGSGQVLTAAASPAVLEAAPSAKKRGLFGNLFASQPKAQKASATAAAAPAPLALADPSPAPQTAKASVTPVLEPANLQLTSLEEAPKKASQTLSDAPDVDNGDLPGVRKGALFEIKRRDSLDSDADIDIGETDGGPVLLASAAGLARLAPNGLKVQRESVDVACLKPQLVKMLKQIEAHYSRPVVVTSGYRSPGYNRRVRGAKNSLHMFCAAADIQVAGVGKWELAKYARSMGNRGGVGTYCHTESVHVDVGPNRDWNWRCSRRK